MTRPSRPFVALLLLATGLLLYVAWPFRTPLFLAVVIAAVLHDPLERLTIAMGGRRTIASGVVTLAVLILIVAPFAALVGFVTREFAGGLAYLRQTLGLLAPIYLVTALIIYAAQSRHGETWRASMESLLATVPVLGTARHYLALSRLAAALGALLSAGVTIIEAWDLAAAASGSPASTCG